MTPEWISILVGSVLILLFICVATGFYCRRAREARLCGLLCAVHACIIVAVVYLASLPTANFEGGEETCRKAEEESCRNSLVCGWCAESSECVAYDCGTKASMPQCAGEVTTDSVCLSYDALRKTIIATGVVASIFAAFFASLLALHIFRVHKRGQSYNATDYAAAGFVAAGGLWVLLLLIAFNKISTPLLPEVDVSHAVLLGVSFIADFKKTLEHAYHKDIHGVRGIILVVAVAWITVFMTTIIFSENYSSSWSAAINAGVLVVDIALTSEEIRELSKWPRIARMAWITFVFAAILTVFVCGFIFQDVAENVDTVLTALVLVQQMMDPHQHKDKEEGEDRALLHSHDVGS